MDFLSHWPLLTTAIVLPLIGALFVLAIPKEDHEMQRTLAGIFSLGTLVLAILMWFGYATGDAAHLWQYEQQVNWIPVLGSTYHVGIDGVSLALIVLTTLLTAIGVFASFTSILERVKSYYAFLLMLDAAMIGIFAARDMLLFYVFWEAMLVPLYFLIGVWGGPNRIGAAVKFFLYTLVGSLLMLVSILVLYFYHLQSTGVPTFDLYELQGMAMPGVLQGWVFFAFFLAFAIKLPLFPFHTWLPDAYQEGPTAAVMVGVLMKTGAYGFYRYAMPLCPQAARFWVPIVMILSIIAIIYAAFIALVQRDMKRLIGYSSVSHIGFIALGLFALNEQGVTGGLIQSINHGISTAAILLLIGMIAERRGTKEIGDFSGIWTVMPSLGVMFIIAICSNVALPGLNGFVGEFPILIGAFERFPWYGILGATGMILGAIYLLWLFQRVFQGPLSEANQGLKDMTIREWAVMLPLVALIFGIGIYPKPLIDRMQPSVTQFLQVMRVPQTGPVPLYGATLTELTGPGASRIPNRPPTLPRGLTPPR